MPTTEKVSINHPLISIAFFANLLLVLYCVIRFLAYLFRPNYASADMLSIMMFMIPVGVSLRACSEGSSRLRRLLAVLLNLLFLLMAVKSMFPAKKVLEPISLWISIPFALGFLINALVLWKKDVVQIRTVNDEVEDGEDGEAGNSSEQESREHHWTMTRVVLPRLLQGEGAASFVASLKQDGTAIVTRIWVNFGKSNISDANKIVPCRGIAVFTDKTPSGKELITIQMPRAIARGEAHFMAIAPGDQDSGYQTFSLEYSTMPRGGKAFTMLTGIQDGCRSNYGLGPVPDKDAFVKAVTALLEKPEPPMTAMKMPSL
ncbi:hypothetical protein UNDKW_4307 [Undibacterium sp. KW1]|uniref:hypothetical protein n=1 Tax=Undibacterium sp. KW1 TaxID=2058624 RepID=UPI001331F7F7|nr:hypothetical protein [Undibacterium sp. KW1]BBB62580.1 hypothetical protein UNDKW_4307 [Undibacterium sp. KW1]